MDNKKNYARNTVTVNISITSEDKKKLKLLAVEKDMTVSKMISCWIAEKTMENNNK